MESTKICGNKKIHMHQKKKRSKQQGDYFKEVYIIAQSINTRNGSIKWGGDFNTEDEEDDKHTRELKEATEILDLKVTKNELSHKNANFTLKQQLKIEKNYPR